MLRYFITYFTNMPKKSTKKVVSTEKKNAPNKMVKMTIPRNGFEQIRSNPYFFTKQSDFFTHLQTARSNTRTAIRNQVFNDYLQRHSLYESYRPCEYIADDDDEMFVKRHRYFEEDQSSFSCENDE